MAKSVRLRLAQLEDIEGIWSLHSSHFPEFREFPFKEFEEICLHKWLRNPARTSRHVFGWLLENGAGKIVGFLGQVPIKFKVGNAIVIGASGTSWIVHPDFRAHSIVLYKANNAWGNDNFLLDTTAGTLAGQLHERLKGGMNRIPIDGFEDRLLWILKAQPLITCKLQRIESWYARLCRSYGFLIALAAIAFRASLFGRAGRVAFGCRELAIVPIEGFTDEFDRFWDEVKDHFPITAERTKEFLNWRHVDVPAATGKSFSFACRDEGRLVGYIVLRTAKYATVIPGHYLVSDLFYDVRRPEILHNLMNFAFQFVRNQKGSLLEIYGYNPAIMNELRKANPFVVKAKNWTYWFKAPAELADVCRQAIWWPSGVDGDLNL